MALNPSCPKCGSGRVQLTVETRRHGCFWLVLFGVYYVLYIIFRWIIGLLVLLFYDWWAAIIHACMGRGHVWKCKYWFSGKRRTYYCHDCGYNFRG